MNDIEIALKNKKETNSIEFKEGREAVPKSIYETVCSFSNRNGGLIILGITDDGDVKGINLSEKERMKKDFATAVNSPIIS